MQTTTDLMPHQAAAVDKLMPARVGALFMEMGTGKTRAAIELVARRAHRVDHVVWCCPASLRATAAYEWRKHTDLAACDVAVWGDAVTARALPDARVHIVGLEGVGSSARIVGALRALITTRSYVIVDESGYIKGHRARRSERLAVLARPARYRLILTGTPITQGVQDLYSQLRFLDEKILGYRSWYTFAANHLEYSEKHRGLIVRAHNTGLLAAKLAPYAYQVTKAECLALPAKFYERRVCHLTDAQRGAYARAKEHYISQVLDLDDPAGSVYLVFRMFTALQQIVCGFWPTAPGGPEAYPHRRLDLLAAALRETPPDAKVIVWAKYRRCVQEIADAIGDAAILWGATAPAERERELARWRDPAGPRHLVATPATGGHGLDLTAAAHVVFYTNGFKYGERVQAEDRCHRIGQRRPVTYLDLVAAGTIDERIAAALDRKEGLAEAFRRQVAAVKDRSRAEVRRMIHELVKEL